MAIILAVDDDRRAQLTLRDLLENLGHEVHLATSLEAALRVATYGVPFDLAVLATQGRSASELVAALREVRPHLPILLAGEDPAAIAVAARECGAAGALAKPFVDVRAIEREIATVLSRAHEPRPAGKPASPEAPQPEASAAGGVGAVVLVAEDNDILRGAMLRVLRGAGIEVLEAESGAHAVRAAAGPRRIDLLVTDVLMPGMTGTELADRLTQDRPGLKVLFISGYPSDACVASAERRSPTGVLQKPFRNVALLEHVRRMLA